MIKNLKPNWTCLAIQYIGQSTEELNELFEDRCFKFINPLTAKNIDGKLYLNHWNCSTSPLDVGDWILFDRDGFEQYHVPDICTKEIIEKYYNLLD